MNSFKRVTKEQADALADAGCRVTETSYLLNIKWSTEHPEYCGRELPFVRTYGYKQDGPLQQRYSALPMYTVEVE